MTYTTLKQLEFEAHARNLKPIRDSLRDIFDEYKVDKDISAEIVIAINEACMNIIQHAYAGKSGKVQIHIEKNKKQWRFELIDFAPMVDINNIKAKDLAEVRPGGLGVNFINKIMDNAIYENINQSAQIGNRLILTKVINMSES